MALLEKGRICVLTKGRHAGEKVTVQGIEKGRAAYTDRKGKRRTCSVYTLFPTPEFEK